MKFRQKNQTTVDANNDDATVILTVTARFLQCSGEQAHESIHSSRICSASLGF